MVAKTIWNQFDVLLADLDGVIYEGTQAIGGAVSSINDLQAQGVRVGYVTNNSSRKPETITQQLQGFGISAKPEDIILVAGKGHENYQEIKGVKHHFDDKEVLREAFGE